MNIAVTVHIALWLTMISILFYQFQCQFTEFVLQSTSMPIDGEAWAIYYQNNTNKIWLLSPRSCIDAKCNYKHNMTIITYDIDHDTFDYQTPIATTTPAMNGWISQYSVAIGDEIYFNGQGGYIDKYDIETGETVTNVFYQDDRQGCLVADDRFVFIIGGMLANSITNAGVQWFVVYDTVTKEWHRASDLPWHPRYLSCQLVNGTIYTFGGDNGTPDARILKVEIGTGNDVLNNLNNNWSQIGNLNVARALHNSVRCDNVDSNLIYIIGGRNSTSSLPELSIEIFDIETETVQTAPFRLNEGRINPAVICINEYIYIFGGRPYKDASTTDSWLKSNALYSSSPTLFPTIEPSIVTVPPNYNPSSSPTDAQTLSGSTVIANTNSPIQRTEDLESTYNALISSNVYPSAAPNDSIYSSTQTDPVSETHITATLTTLSTLITTGSSPDVVMSVLVCVIIALICICILVLIYIIYYLRNEKRKLKKIVNAANDEVIIEKPDAMKNVSKSVANDMDDDNDVKQRGTEDAMMYIMSKTQEAMRNVTATNDGYDEEPICADEVTKGYDLKNEGEDIQSNLDFMVMTGEGETMNGMILNDDEFIIQGDDETTQ